MAGVSGKAARECGWYKDTKVYYVKAGCLRPTVVTGLSGKAALRLILVRRPKGRHALSQGRRLEMQARSADCQETQVILAYPLQKDVQPLRASLSYVHAAYT